MRPRLDAVGNRSTPEHEHGLSRPQPLRSLPKRAPASERGRIVDTHPRSIHSMLRAPRSHSSLQRHKVHDKAESVKTEDPWVWDPIPPLQTVGLVDRPWMSVGLEVPSRGWTAAASSRASAQPGRVACWPILARLHHPSSEARPWPWVSYRIRFSPAAASPTVCCRVSSSFRPASSARGATNTTPSNIHGRRSGQRGPPTLARGKGPADIPAIRAMVWHGIRDRP